MEPLRLNDVGPYGGLAARPNPDGLAIVTVPAFESMIPFIEQRYGRPLTSQELEAERQKAPSIVLSATDAEKFESVRRSR